MSNSRRSGDKDTEDFLEGSASGSAAALPRVAAVITGTLGLVVLAGWTFAIPALKSVLPGAVEMTANTAVGLVLAASALFIRCNRPSPLLLRLGRILALAVAALGLATLSQYVFGWQLGIDELLFRDSPHAYNAFRGRMSPYASLGFALIGLALGAVPRSALRPLAWIAAILVMAIGALAYVGYLWNVSELVSDRWLPPMAVNTAFAFLLLGAGAFLANRAPQRRRATAPSMARSSIETRILAGFIGALALLFVASGYTYRTSVEFAESARRIAHTQQMRAELNRLDASISTAESEQRHYLLTGEPKNKEKYTRHALQVDQYQRSLSRLVADNPAQAQTLAALRPFIVQRMDSLARQVLLFEREGRSAALADMAGDNGIPAMEAIDVLIDRMDDTETELLSRRESDLARTRELSLLALLAMLAVATAALIFLFLGIRREFAARAHVEDALRASEKYKRAILDTVVDGVITIDGRGKVESINPAAERVFGYAAAEVLGGNVSMLMPEPDRSQHDAHLERYRASGDAHIIGMQREVVGKRKDGSTFTMELAVSEMRLGEERHYTGSLRDITSRKEAERDLVAARNEAERANAAKDTFLATMSHEIRTPLNGLLGMLELLGLSRLEGEQREMLQIARDSGRGLVRIIDDVLDHAKIAAGKLEICLEPVSITQILRRVLNTYQAVASANNVTLQMSMDPQISPSLLADPLRVQQILNNLVSNALKFTAEGYVELRAELLGQAHGASTVRLSVKDTGIGIEPEAQLRLFQPFEQAGADTAIAYGGTGLGLSISRRLAEMMGGSIDVKSVPGEGTTMSVTLTLPICDIAPAKSAGEATPAVAPMLAAFALGAGPLVLAVDDHPTNLELLARQIAALGLRVQTAADGQEALALWQDGAVALVLTDCNMPQMDGYALSRAMREIEAKEGRPRTPIIAWTANVLSGAADLCHAAGMDDILTKPTDLAMLKQTLAKWLPSAATATAGLDDATGARPATAASAPIDLTELNKIALSATERAKILLDFMAQMRSDLARLRAAWTVQDLPACARIAHRMKGSSAMMGARELAAACDGMEHAAGQGGDAGPVMAAMERALERLEAHLAAAARASAEQT